MGYHSSGDTDGVSIHLGGFVVKALRAISTYVSVPSAILGLLRKIFFLPLFFFISYKDKNWSSMLKYQQGMNLLISF
jgi:hypothetical protein